MRKGGRPARIQPFCSESQENQSPTQKEQAGEWGHALGLSGGTIHHTADASLFLWSAGKKAPHRKKNLLHITKKAGSKPQGLSGRLRRAGVSVMGSFLDQTARATADRKALSAVTEMADPSHPCKPVGKYSEHTIPRVRWYPMWRAPTAMTCEVTSFTLLPKVHIKTH